MFFHYCKSALRNLLKNRSHSLVNITGLLVGFSAFLIIFQVLAYEKSFDGFHAKKDRIFRVVREGKGENKEYRTGVPFPVTQGLRTDLPQIENAAAIYGDYNVQVIIPDANGHTNKKFKESQGVYFAEPQFFGLFDFKIVAGNPGTSLKEPNTAMLTKAFAAKYFGNWNNAIGKIVKAYGADIKITGIVENPPVNTDFPLGLIISYATLGVNMSDWASIADNNYCFVQLPANYAASNMQSLMTGFVNKHISLENRGYELILEPLKEMHTDSRFGNFNGRVFSEDLVTALSLIGFFLLIVACVNFINLSTANAINRSKEVGVRKVMGSSRGQLIAQFFGETGAACLIAMVGAVLIAIACLPLINNLLEIHLTLNILNQPVAILFIIGTLLLVTLLSGLYPALILAGYNPINALKSKFQSESTSGTVLRRGLVVFQFVIAQVLIIGTLVVIAQMNYFNKADMGFSKEAIVNASFPGDSLSRTKLDQFKNELSNVPGVKEVSLSTFAPSGYGGWASDLKLAGNLTNNADLIVQMKPADTSYFNVYNLQLAAGRRYFASDTTSEFVVNETLVNRLSLGSPEKAIGQMIVVAGEKAPIVGVVKDFHMHSLKEAIDPVVMMSSKRRFGITNIKIEPGKTKATLAALENLWNKTYPDFVFEYNFVDQTIADYYKQEIQLSKLYTIFAGIAIFISCLGLYGLISFMAVRRRKEIGIRKVLGAPVSNIILLLSREFTILIAIAFIIAAPIAWYFMHQWLQQYNFQIRMGAGFFAITFIVSILIAWITVGHSAIKAALANPVNSLKTE